MKILNSKKKPIYWPSYINYLIVFLLLLLTVNLVIFFWNRKNWENKNDLLFTKQQQIQSQQSRSLLEILQSVGNAQIMLQETRHHKIKKSKNKNLNVPELERLILSHYFDKYLNLSRKIKSNSDVFVLPLKYKQSNWLFKNEYQNYNLKTRNLSWTKRFEKTFQINKFNDFLRLKRLLQKIQKYSRIVFGTNKFEIDFFYSYFFGNNVSNIKNVVGNFFTFFKLFNKKMSLNLSKILTKIKFKDLFQVLFTSLNILNAGRYIKDQKTNEVKYQNLLILAKTLFEKKVFSQSIILGVNINEITFNKIKTDKKWIQSLMMKMSLKELRIKINQVSADRFVKNFLDEIEIKYPISVDVDSVIKLLAEEPKNINKKFKKIQEFSFISKNLFLFQVWFFDYLIWQNDFMPSNLNEMLSNLYTYLMKFNVNVNFIGSDYILEAIKNLYDVKNAAVSDAYNVMLDLLKIKFKETVLKFIKKIQKPLFLKDTSKIDRFLNFFLPKINFSELNKILDYKKNNELNQSWNLFLTFLNLNWAAFKKNPTNLEIENLDDVNVILQEKQKLIFVLPKSKELHPQVIVSTPNKPELYKMKSISYTNSMTKEWTNFEIYSNVNDLKVKLLQINKKPYLLWKIMEKFLSFLSLFLNNFVFKFSIFNNWNFLLFAVYQILLTFKIFKNNNEITNFFKSFKSFFDSKILKVFINKIIQIIMSFIEIIKKIIILGGHWDKNIYQSFGAKELNHSFLIILKFLGYIPREENMFYNNLNEGSKIIKGSFIQLILKILNPSYSSENTKITKQISSFLKQKLMSNKNIFDDLISTIDQYLEENFYFYLNSKNWAYRDIKISDFNDFSARIKKEMRIEYSAFFKIYKIPFKFKFIWKITLDNKGEYVFSLLDIEKKAIV